MNYQFLLLLLSTNIEKFFVGSHDLKFNICFLISCYNNSSQKNIKETYYSRFFFYQNYEIQQTAL